MFWVIQNNLYREYGYLALLDSLKRLEIPYATVKVVPIINKLIHADFDTHSYFGDFSEIEEPFIDESKNVMVCGTLSLAKTAAKKGWIPGSFLNDNFHFNEWKKHFGENLLNFESIVGRFEDIKIKWNEFFVRPCEDSKAFSGTQMNIVHFDNWRKDLLSIKNDLWILNEDTEIVASPLKEIYSEYRCFVVDGKVITTSRYKMGETVIYKDDISDQLKTFAQCMVERWQPARAFVLDVAETSEGNKIVEINNFNSAGFYACDVRKIVEAVEEMKF